MGFNRVAVVRIVFSTSENRGLDLLGKIYPFQTLQVLEKSLKIVKNHPSRNPFDIKGCRGATTADLVGIDKGHFNLQEKNISLTGMSLSAFGIIFMIRNRLSKKGRFWALTRFMGCCS